MQQLTWRLHYIHKLSPVSSRGQCPALCLIPLLSLCNEILFLSFVLNGYQTRFDPYFSRKLVSTPPEKEA